MMKKPTNKWFQPQGWLSFGALIVVALLVIYLIYMGVSSSRPACATSTASTTAGLHQSSPVALARPSVRYPRR